MILGCNDTIISTIVRPQDDGYIDVEFRFGRDGKLVLKADKAVKKGTIVPKTQQNQSDPPFAWYDYESHANSFINATKDDGSKKYKIIGWNKNPATTKITEKTTFIFSFKASV